MSTDWHLKVFKITKLTSDRTTILLNLRLLFLSFLYHRDPLGQRHRFLMNWTQSLLEIFLYLRSLECLHVLMIKRRSLSWTHLMKVLSWLRWVLILTLRHVIVYKMMNVIDNFFFFNIGSIVVILVMNRISQFNSRNSSCQRVQSTLTYFI
jgi:hypothetical protein